MEDPWARFRNAEGNGDNNDDDDKIEEESE
jgi:hypothetical protein